MKYFTLIWALFSLSIMGGAQEADSTRQLIALIEKSIKYQTGTIELASGNATVQVPAGFKFIDKEQAQYVLTVLWDNIEDTTILGLLVPENHGILDADSWVFTLKFDDIGFVKDTDVDEIDYAEMLLDLQKDALSTNIERKKLGKETVEMIGWASTPFYDKQKKVLHWAKEINFEQSASHTLNYNLRILGRKGVFMLNAVASMDQLAVVSASIDPILNSIQLKEGHRYTDFIPTDHIAEWTIGSLVAGKVAAKFGFFALIAKFWKIIAISIAATFGSIWNYFKKKKLEHEEPTSDL